MQLFRLLGEVKHFNFLASDDLRVQTSESKKERQKQNIQFIDLVSILNSKYLSIT